MASPWVECFDSEAEEYYYYNKETKEMSLDEPEEGYGTAEDDKEVQAVIKIQSAQRTKIAKKRVEARRSGTFTPGMTPVPRPTTADTEATGATEDYEEEYGDDDFEADDYGEDDFEDEEEALQETVAEAAVDKLLEDKYFANSSFAALQRFDVFVAAARSEAKAYDATLSKLQQQRLDGFAHSAKKNFDARARIEQEDKARVERNRRINMADAK